MAARKTKKTTNKKAVVTGLDILHVRFLRQLLANCSARERTEVLEEVQACVDPQTLFSRYFDDGILTAQGRRLFEIALRGPDEPDDARLPCCVLGLEKYQSLAEDLAHLVNDYWPLPPGASQAIRQSFRELGPANIVGHAVFAAVRAREHSEEAAK